MNDYTKNTKFNTRKLRLGIMSGFIITTLIWVFAIVPQQPSRAEQIISNLQGNTGMIEKPQMNTGGGLSNNVVTNGNANEKYEPETTGIVLNNNGNGEIKENNQEGNEFVLETNIYLQHNVDCDDIVMHNDFATESAKYYCKLLPNKIMLSAFNQESGYNPNALGGLGEMGVCQLLPNRTNNVWLKDPRRKDWKRQAERCVDKWKAVVNHRLIWSSVGSNEYKKYLYLFE